MLVGGDQVVAIGAIILLAIYRMLVGRRPARAGKILFAKAGA